MFNTSSKWRMKRRLQYSLSSLDVSEVCVFWRLLTLMLHDELPRAGFCDLSWSLEEKMAIRKSADSLELLLHMILNHLKLGNIRSNHRLKTEIIGWRLMRSQPKPIQTQTGPRSNTNPTLTLPKTDLKQKPIPVPTLTNRSYNTIVIPYPTMLNPTILTN